MKNGIKMITLAFCLVFILNAFPVMSAEDNGASAQSDSVSVPQVKSIIYEDTFDSSSLDSRITKESGSGDMNISGGSLVLNRPDDAKVNVPDEAKIYLNADKSGNASAQTVVEFIISRSELRLLDFGFYDEDDNRLTGVRFLKNGYVGLTKRSSLSAEPAFEGIGKKLAADEDVTVTVSVNHTTSAVMLWLDGSLCAEGYCETSSDNLAYMNVLMRISSYQTVSIRSIRAYESQLTSGDIVDMDSALLSFADLSREPQHALTANLSLPVNGVNGSFISWSSSNEAAVSSLGEVTRSSMSDSNVTLTASISHEGTVKTKTFELTVLRLSSTPMPAVKTLLAENSLKSAKQSDMLSAMSGAPVFGADGIRLSIGEDGADSVSHFHNNARDAYVDLIVYEIAVSGDNVAIELGDTTESFPFAIRFENNAIYASTRSAYGEAVAWSKLKDGIIDGRKLIIAADPISGMMSVWYGEDKLLTASLGAESVGRLQRLSARQLSGTSLITDFRAYIPVLPEEDAALYDLAALDLRRLTWQDSDDIWENLNLPTVGNCGSSIVWNSTDASVIDAWGKVTVPDIGAKEVTLTATVTNGSVTKQRSHTLTVVPHVRDEMPEQKNPYVSEDFTTNIVGTTWTSGQGGGFIGVRDERLELKRLVAGDGNTTTTMRFDTAYLQGVYALEFTVNKTKSDMLYIRTDGKGDYFHANWGKDGNLRVYNGESHSIVGNFGTKAKFTVLYNTPKSTFSLWVNDKLVCKDYLARGLDTVNIRSVQFYTNAAQLTEAEIDNLRFYEAYPLYAERIELDHDTLKELMLYSPTDTAASYGLVTENLILPTLGTYGSNISWSSSDPSVISDSGVVTLGDDEKTVTLTATISAGDGTVYEQKTQKELTFRVASNVASDDAAAVRAEADMLTYAVVARDENGADKIKRPLNFVSSGVYGSNITWNTSDPVHITSSGRVIRPYCGESDASVTVTATITRGSASISKSFEFTVIADEAFADPQYMTDEEFFGKWNGSTWTIKPKFNYDYTDSNGTKVLAKLGKLVQEASATGDYTAAKEELLNYFQNVRPSYSTVSTSSRNTGWANLVVDEFYHTQRSSYYQGSGYLGNDWAEMRIPVSSEDLTSGVNVAYSVRAWYNESSYALFARHDAADAKMRPKLELTVNGAIKTIESEDTIEVRAGDYSSTNFDSEEYMTVQTFGDFHGNDTRYAKVRFNLSDIRETDVVTKATLVLYGRAEPAFGGDKRIAVIKEPDSTWKSELATWNSFAGYVYGMNGLTDETKPTWEFIDGADIEYLWQVCRFYAWPSIAIEYRLTGNDYYAYKAQRIMENFITKTGGYLSDIRSYDYTNSGTGDDDDDIDLRGGYPRTLDAALRMQNWNQSINDLIKSPYATPDFCTALLKNMWDTYTFLTHYNTDSGNWRQFEHQSMLDGSIRMPEFADSKDGTECYEELSWYERSTAVLEKMLFDSNFADGSYVEACNGYSVDAFSGYVNYKADLLATGNDVSEEYDTLLHAMAYYQALLYTSDGMSLSYGDAGESKRPTAAFEKVIDWYDDDVLEYIISYGERGTKPDWTSRSFPSSLVTTMRADWSKTAPYLFTNVRGGGQHGHADYNGIVLSAYNRILLTDAGKFTYESTDPYRVYAQSTKAHNTVMINDTNQRKITADDGEKFENANGAVLDFATNSAFDYLLQSSTSYSGFDHRRSITFIKPNIFIVSDRIDPTDTTKQNNYKQLWHMLPGAGLEISEDSRTVYSNYATGANIILANADESASTKQEMGWYDRGYQVVEPAPFGYFEKKNIAGTTTFDTVIAVNNEDSTAALVSEKLTTTGDATAVKFDITKNGESFTGYYRMSYDGSVGIFGSYTTDAQVAYVLENAKGEIVSVLMKNGTYVNKDGTAVLQSETKAEEVYVDLSGTNAYITTDAFTDAAGLTVYSTKVPLKLYINDEVTSFTKNGNYITGIGGAAVVPQKPATGPQVGIVEDSISENASGGSSSGGASSGGSSSGGGSAGGGSVGGGTIGGYTPSGFADLAGHWAESYVNDLKSKNIVNGDANGNFNPDNSITRAEFVAIVTRSLGIADASYSDTFGDVAAGDWFAPSVQGALDYGLISKDIVFRPHDLITRQEMAKIIVIAADLARKYETAESKLHTLGDADSVDAWAKHYVDTILKSGLMQGRTDGGFHPKDNATRAESATVISRMISAKN